ncbi:hypothetical protein TNCV_1589151 [Trichonephila clavipes]|uniref:Uncharacterized protein n=1 Tax=Trichonephila clavipes TaxID=2585209 RepID=A0A8X6V410_TRICX|nr:hypothetical protein TNCV_1589151 [Trichonephila clavipes]
MVVPGGRPRPIQRHDIIMKSYRSSYMVCSSKFPVFRRIYSGITLCDLSYSDQDLIVIAAQSRTTRGSQGEEPEPGNVLLSATHHQMFSVGEKSVESAVQDNISI